LWSGAQVGQSLDLGPTSKNIAHIGASFQQ